MVGRNAERIGHGVVFQQVSSGLSGHLKEGRGVCGAGTMQLRGAVKSNSHSRTSYTPISEIKAALVSTAVAASTAPGIRWKDGTG